MIEKILTADGSPTFFSQKYGEPFHSISAGAFLEATEKFIKPTKIVEKSKTREVKILDICFGLGFNSLMAIHTAKKENRNAKLLILSFEKEIEVIKYSYFTNWKELNYLKPIFRNLLLNRKYEQEFLTLNHADNYLKIKIFIGDGRKILQKIHTKYIESFDAVFHDPFSPKVNPELWSYDFFKLVSSMTIRNGIIATYSCASPIRKALHMANFGVKEGVALGRKSKSTVGIKGGETTPHLKEKFQTVITTVPFRDPLLKDPPNLIKNRRQTCIQLLKHD